MILMHRHNQETPIMLQIHLRTLKVTVDWCCFPPYGHSRSVDFEAMRVPQMAQDFWLRITAPRISQTEHGHFSHFRPESHRLPSLHRSGFTKLGGPPCWDKVFVTWDSSIRAIDQLDGSCIYASLIVAHSSGGLLQIIHRTGIVT